MLDQPQATVGSGEAEPVETRVFLSYSRKDALFTRRLVEALSLRGYAPDFDQSARDPANIDTGISAEDEWWQRLQQMIAAADVMVFIVSPDSAASRVCDEEIAYARNLGKRIIPVLRRPIDFAKAPPRLSALNVKIDFTDDGEVAFAAALAQLTAALDLDVAWHRESRRLVELALKWEAEGRPADRVMSPADIRASEQPAGAPAEERRSAAAGARRFPRGQPHPPGGGDASAAPDDGACIRQAGRAGPEGWAARALRCGSAAAGALLVKDLDFDLKVDTQLLGPCRTGDLREPHVRGTEGPCHCCRHRGVYPDGRRVVTASKDNTRIWDAATGNEIATLQGHTNRALSAAFSPDGRRIVTASPTTPHASGMRRQEVRSPSCKAMPTVWGARRSAPMAGAS